MTTININNLTKSQLEDLERQIAEAKEKLNTTYGRKIVEKGNRYYYFHSDWSINDSVEVNDSIDKWRFNLWNYYLTREEAVQARDRQLAIVRVNNTIDKLNWDWEYKVWDEYYTIVYSTYNHKFTYEKCEYIRSFYIYKIKTLKIVKQIISKYENDLKIIFNVE